MENFNDLLRLKLSDNIDVRELLRVHIIDMFKHLDITPMFLEEFAKRDGNTPDMVKDSILSIPKFINRTDAFISHVRRGGTVRYMSFIETLEHLGDNELAERWIGTKPEPFEFCTFERDDELSKVCLTDEQRKIIKTNIDELVSIIDIDPVIDILRAKGRISLCTHKELRLIEDNSQRIMEFFHKLLKCNQRVYYDTIAALNESGQRHIASKYFESEIAQTSTCPDAPVCSVCMQNVPNAVYVECGHMVCCVPCATKLEKCPVCRKQGKWVRVFTS